MPVFVCVESVQSSCGSYPDIALRVFLEIRNVLVGNGCRNSINILFSASALAVVGWHEDTAIADKAMRERMIFSYMKCIKVCSAESVFTMEQTKVERK